MTINPEEWQFLYRQRGDQIPLMADLWCQAIKSNFSQELGVKVEFDYLMINNKAYVKKKQHQKILSIIQKKVRNNEGKILQEKALKRVEEFKEIIDKVCNKDYLLLERWILFKKSMLNLIPWFFIPWYVIEENFLTDELQKILLKEGKSEDDVILLSNPVKDLAVNEEQRLLYEIAKSKNDEKKINLYLKEFSWMNTFILQPLEKMTKEDVINKISKEFVKEYEERRTKKEKEKERAKKIYAEVDEKTKLLIDEIRESGWFLSYSVDEALKAFADGIIFYKEIANKIGSTYQDWVYFKEEEITQMLREEKIMNNSNARKEGFITILDQNNIYYYEGEEVVKKYSLLLENNEKRDLITGKSAVKGKVSGKVKIITGEEKIISINKGDILVTSMTNPRFVPAMQKAAAIVTDEGGLLCHAAIIARELQKPCIIGTKIATKALQDGDEVEVDANKGVVRRV